MHQCEFICKISRKNQGSILDKIRLVQCQNRYLKKYQFAKSRANLASYLLRFHGFSTCKIICIRDCLDSWAIALSEGYKIFRLFFF